MLGNHLYATLCTFEKSPIMRDGADLTKFRQTDFIKATIFMQNHIMRDRPNMLANLAIVIQITL